MMDVVNNIYVYVHSVVYMYNFNICIDAFTMLWCVEYYQFP